MAEWETQGNGEHAPHTPVHPSATPESVAVDKDASAPPAHSYGSLASAGDEVAALRGAARPVHPFDGDELDGEGEEAPAEVDVSSVPRLLPSGLYAAPIDPRGRLSPTERVQLAWAAARPWSEFGDWRALSLPNSRAEMSLRVRSNLEMYAWNYAFVAMLIAVLLTVRHPLGASALAVCAVVYGRLLAMTPPLDGMPVAPEAVTDSLSWTSLDHLAAPWKYAIVGTCVLAAVCFTSALWVALDMVSASLAVAGAHAVLHNPP